MKAADFKALLGRLPDLSAAQRALLSSRLTKADEREEVIQLLEQGPPPACPYCGQTGPHRWGRQAGLQRFRCRQCQHTYNVLSGTPLARLHYKERWLAYCDALVQSLSVRKAAAECDVDTTTSFRWRHRFLARPARNKPDKLCGIVEADETYFPLSYKGQRILPRAPHRRGHAVHEVGTGAEKVPVLVLRDRMGITTDYKLGVANTVEIEPLLKAHLAEDAVLCSDGGAAYKRAARHLGLTHRAVNLTAGQRVLNGAYHIQNVNAYDSRLKGWMARFHGVATRYLENYLGWRRMLDGLTTLTPVKTLNVVIAREMPYQLVMQT